jgi:hypothetical protein
MARAGEFVVALLSGDEAQMNNAFYDPDYGRNPRLYEVIREKRGPGWRTSDEQGYLISWFREALKGYTIDQLDPISENLYRDFGGRKAIFRLTQRALIFCINELFHADEMVKAVLRDADIGGMANKFETHFSSIGLIGRQQRARMSMPMERVLSRLDPQQMDILRANLRAAPLSLAVTELRKLVADQKEQHRQ